MNGGSLVSAFFIGGGGVFGILLALLFSWGLTWGILSYLVGSLAGFGLLALLKK